MSWASEANYMEQENRWASRYGDDPEEIGGPYRRTVPVTPALKTPEPPVEIEVKVVGAAGTFCHGCGATLPDVCCACGQCPQCGSMDLAVDGYVCIGCRRDIADWEALMAEQRANVESGVIQDSYPLGLGTPGLFRSRDEVPL